MLSEATMEMLYNEQKEMKKRNEIASRLLKDDPKLSEISAIIIAGDIRSAEKADHLIENEGFTYSQAQSIVGSYARLDWSLRAMERGLVTLDDLLDELPQLWRGSDPDDTDPRFLDLWKKAWERNGRKYIRDGKTLPRTKMLQIYRGQDEGSVLGIAWTLNQKIAEKFAQGAGTRQTNRGGTIYHTEIPRTKVLAYLTGRGESEIIIDPTNLG